MKRLIQLFVFIILANTGVGQVYLECSLNSNNLNAGSARFTVFEDRMEFTIKTIHAPDMLNIMIGEDYEFSTDVYTDFYSSSTGSYFGGFDGPYPIFLTSPAIVRYREFTGTVSDESLIHFLRTNNNVAISVNGDTAYSSVGMLSLTDDNLFHWLSRHGYNQDVDLYADHDGDGFALITEYALNLDPHQHSTSRLPKLTDYGVMLAFRFYADRPSIHYRVLVSENLVDWSDSGLITYSESNGNAVATLNTTGKKNVYLKLIIEYTNDD